MDLNTQVRKSIEDIHVFFEDWFMGRVDAASLEAGFMRYLAPDFRYIPPGGPVVSRADLEVMFNQGHGTASDFKIEIHDVVIRWQSGTHVLASYTELQAGAAPPAAPRNARLSSVLMAKAAPLVWHYVQETQVPL